MTLWRAKDVICKTILFSQIFFSEFRLRYGRATNEGRIEYYSKGKWSPICYSEHNKPKSITEYCQELGYADGIDIRMEGQVINENVATRDANSCQDGNYLRIRCHSKST